MDKMPGENQIEPSPSSENPKYSEKMNKTEIKEYLDRVYEYLDDILREKDLSFDQIGGMFNNLASNVDNLRKAGLESVLDENKIDKNFNQLYSANVYEIISKCFTEINEDINLENYNKIGGAVLHNPAHYLNKIRLFLKISPKERFINKLGAIVGLGFDIDENYRRAKEVYNFTHNAGRADKILTDDVLSNGEPSKSLIENHGKIVEMGEMIKDFLSEFAYLKDIDKTKLLAELKTAFQKVAEEVEGSKKEK